MFFLPSTNYSKVASHTVAKRQMLSPSFHRAFSYPQVFQGVLERSMKHKLLLMGKIGTQLDILLENMGRLSFGSNHSDFKVSCLRLRSFLLLSVTIFLKKIGP